MSGDCAGIVERLIDGGGGKDAAADPEVAAHVGSCLDCFRALTELRDVPRLAELLRRDGHPTAADPGPAFWDALAARTVEAAAAGLPSGLAARPASPRRARRRATTGVLAGLAAGALALALIAVRATPPAGPASDGAARPPVEVAVEGAGAEADLEAAGGGPADVAALDGPELQRLLEALRSSEPVELRALIDGDGQDGIADQIAALDAAALRRLTQRLAGSTL